MTDLFVGCSLVVKEERREEAGVALSRGKVDGALCETDEEKIQVMTRE